jgi:hypothetical protein
VPWRDDILHIMGLSGFSYTNTPRTVLENLADDDFLFWVLFASSQNDLRQGYVYSRVTPALEGRGVIFNIYGEPHPVRRIFGRIAAVLAKSWEKWDAWLYRFEAVALRSTRTLIHHPDAHRDKGDLSIELRIYPPLDTVAGTTCKDLWQHCVPDKTTTSSDVLALIQHALERHLAKKCKEKEANVGQSPLMNIHCK